MALLLNGQKSLNNMERNQGVAVYDLDVASNVEDRGGDVIPLQEGDMIIMGVLPEKAMVEAMYLDLNKMFTAGTTIDINIAQMNKNKVVSLLPIVAGVVLDASGGIMHIPLPIAGNIDVAGAPYAGVSPIMKVDSNVEALAITIHGTDIEVGKLRFVIPYSSYTTKSTGAYLS